MAKQRKIRLNLGLPEGWDYAEEQPEDGPMTFVHDDPDAGVFQVSLQVDAMAGQDVGEDDLVGMCEDMGESAQLGELVESGSGRCAMGIYGTAIFTSEQFPHSQVWVLSDGTNALVASLTGTADRNSEHSKQIWQAVMKATAVDPGAAKGGMGGK